MTFEKAEKRLQDIDNIVPKDMKRIIIANKIDNLKGRVVS